MLEPRDRSQRLAEKEIGLILKRAAELQHRESMGTSLSLTELEQVAQEAGIEPRFVRRAAAELEARPPRNAARLLGAPTLVAYERMVDGEVPPAAYEVLVEEIRRALNDVGAVNTLGRSFAWHSTNIQRPVHVTVSPRNGQTRIRVEERLGNLAGGLFGGIMGGVGGGGMGVAMGVGIGVFNAPAAAALLAAGIVAASYALARGIFSGVAGQRAATLRRLTDALAEDVTEAVRAESQSRR